MILTDTQWRNWGRTEKTYPRRVKHPGSIEAVQRAVLAAAKQGLTVKTVGAGHSFTGIAAARDVLLDLVNLRGVLGVNKVKKQVRLAAGTRLHELPRLLAPYRLALQNMGDIDRQTIAGAVSTGTHGTGAGFGGIATQIVAMTLVTADGSLLHVSAKENPELLPAVRVGLGALGVIVDITLQCVPAFLLHAVEKPEPLAAVLEEWPDRIAQADHFEFYWFPHTETALTKTNTRLPLGAPRQPLGRLSRWIDDELVANRLFALSCELGRIAPGVIPRINRSAEKLTGDRDFTDASYKVFVTNRAVRFREMEFALPQAEIPEVVRRIRQLIEDRGWRISFPIEVRAAASDENWMSTAYGRETGYVAVHRYYRETPGSYFTEVEQIFREHGGRPHWGKLHTRTEEYFREVYPRFDDFLAVRDRLDPEGRFGNAYLQSVLGEIRTADVTASRPS